MRGVSNPPVSAISIFLVLRLEHIFLKKDFFAVTSKPVDVGSGHRSPKRLSGSENSLKQKQKLKPNEEEMKPILLQEPSEKGDF